MTAYGLCIGLLAVWGAIAAGAVRWCNRDKDQETGNEHDESA